MRVTVIAVNFGGRGSIQTDGKCETQSPNLSDKTISTIKYHIFAKGRIISVRMCNFIIYSTIQYYVYHLSIALFCHRLYLSLCKCLALAVKIVNCYVSCRVVDQVQIMYNSCSKYGRNSYYCCSLKILHSLTPNVLYLCYYRKVI